MIWANSAEHLKSEKNHINHGVRRVYDFAFFERTEADISSS